MPPDDTEVRLSQLATRWSVVDQARVDGDAAQRARLELLQRYGGAAFRYLRAACGSSDVALDLAQEFGLRVLRGDLRGADSCRGRFRDYVKAVLTHLAADHFRRVQRDPGPLPDDSALLPAAPPEIDAREFTRLWREELLDRTWDALRDDESRQPHYAVLRWRLDHPGQTAEVAADALGAAIGRELTAANYRQLLHRARERFAELLIREVERSLGTSSRDAVRDELAELELLCYCGPALADGSATSSR